MILSPPVRGGEEFNLSIESVGKKGDGIAKIDKFTIFVPGSKLGEKVKVKITRVLEKFAFAEVVEVIKTQDTENFGG